MPAAAEYKLTSDGQPATDIKQDETARDEFNARAKLVESNWRYYYGQHEPHLKITNNVDDNVVVNVCRMAVDRTASFLLPEMPALELDLAETTEDEQWLADMWDWNGGVVTLGKLFLNGAMGGHLYGRVLLPQRGDPFPKIIPLNPANVITWWNEDNHDQVLWHELRWHVDTGDGWDNQKANYRQDVVAERDANDEIVRWWIYEFVRKNGSQWTPVDEGILWEFPLGPIQQTQHLPAANVFYGEHELNHRELNDQINKVASDINRILRFHAGPKSILFGADLGDLIESAIEGVWSIMNADARMENLEMQSDLTASMSYLETLKDMFFTLSRVVILKGGLDAFRGMTNLGIRSAFMDMSNKNETLRRQYGKLIQQLSQVGMMVAGRVVEEPTVVWGEALPVDKREEFDLIDRQRMNGYISMETARGRLGINHEVEEQRITMETVDEAIIRDGIPVGVSG